MAREIFEELKDWIFWLLENGEIIERGRQNKTYGAKRGKDIHDFYMLEVA